MKKFLKNKTIQDSIVVFLLGVALGWHSIYMYNNGKPHYEWKMSPYLFPLIVAIFAVLMSISLFADGRRELKAEESGEAVKTAGSWKKILKPLGVIAFAIIYYVLMQVIPTYAFIISTIIFLVAMFLFFGERRWWLIAITSVATSGIIYVLFGVLLKVRLP